MSIFPLDVAALTLRVDTDRFGPFAFRPGVSPAGLELALHRIDDAHRRFVASPLSQVANKLEKEVVASSVFGTNAVEGGTLSEEETASALDLDPAQVQAVEQRRALNIKAAYDAAHGASATPGWALSVDFLVELHRLITTDIPHPDNRPGVLRDTRKGRFTYVGDEVPGGRYKPPQYGGDVARLLTALIDWHDRLAGAGVPALVRAPLVHLYHEQIHPFWDGNGRVGRVVEATLLQAAGYRYAPFALARYYLQNIDTYFTLFNTCRKRAARGDELPNHDFVAFHLDGMLHTVNALHDRVNRLVEMLLYESAIRRALDEKTINARQYTILSMLLDRGQPYPLAELRHVPWYESLYLKRNDKTRQRDLRRLRELELAFLDTGNRLWPGIARPPQIRPLGKADTPRRIQAKSH